MTNTIEIMGNGNSVTITVQGYEKEAAQSLSDANWLQCEVSVKLPNFLVDIPVNITTQDFYTFYNDLKLCLKNMTGSASFLTDEDQLQVKIELKKSGHANIVGIVQRQYSPKAALSFSFESDQSYLQQTLTELESIIVKFPIVRNQVVKPQTKLV